MPTCSRIGNVVAPVTALEANTPVSTAPTMPPTPCTPKASSESSQPIRRLSTVAPQKHTTPPTSPISNAGSGSTKPDAGVITTSPATAPDTIPSKEGLPRKIHSQAIQLQPAAAAAIWLTRIASTARSLAASPEPPLKPNQPIHKIQAPSIVNVRLCGLIGSFPYPKRLPTTRQPTRPAIPALI